jgi:hypothetical protein
MFRERVVRSIGVLGRLIASTIQGLTPDADSLASRLASRSLQLLAAAGDRGAALGRIRDADRSRPPGMIES